MPICKLLILHKDPPAVLYTNIPNEENRFNKIILDSQ
jgi:hypothetical protein